ncbi:hypothetical protein QA612_00925 [Evansella sp. AB-P1]|uniref:hypothetical protein n=1 Tax=Evansella sp. AB-P1 TaxID=3037653 RepID=UPI00241E8F9D|nr:hypothetical protein [Evansella sp. AB-P1]MDG5786033.1 hypothetical protein [Evansella sp. AB-P1]
MKNNRGFIMSITYFIISIVFISIVYFFDIYPYSFSYEMMEDQIVVQEGVLTPTNYVFDRSEVDELSVYIVASEIDQLRNTALTVALSLSFCIFFLILLVKKEMTLYPKSKIEILQMINILGAVILFVSYTRLYLQHVETIRQTIERLF